MRSSAAVTPTLVVALIALSASGCGASGHARRAGASSIAAADPAMAACSARARNALAHGLGRTGGSIRTAAFIATSGAPSCRFSVAGDRARMVFVASIDDAPQAYFRLERETVEYAQNVLWSHAGAGAYPRPVGRLGVDASWFPAAAKLITTDGRNLITVGVSWPGVTAGRRLGVAEDVARSYLTR